MQRRDFLKISGAITALSLTHRVLAGPSQRISIIIEGGNPCASSDPVGWAAGRLRNALVAKGVDLRDCFVSGSSCGFCLFCFGGWSSLRSRRENSRRQAQRLSNPESLRLTPGRADGRAGDLGLCSRPEGVCLWAAGVDGAGPIQC